MKNRDYIEGFIEGVSVCWNNGMKVCPEYTAIYIDTFFIDNDKKFDEIFEKVSEINEEAYLNGYGWAALIESYLENNYLELYEA